MPQRSHPSTQRRSSREHAQWIRDHARIDDSAFPEYPDDPQRRGSSRGALPNGNPWMPERDDQPPGPTWSHPTQPSSSEPAAPRSRLPRVERRVEAPPGPNERAKGRITTAAATRTDQRIARDVERRLSQSKHFDGKLAWVEVHAGEVFLRGRLISREAKAEAQLLASSVRGVVAVHNQLRIAKTP